MSYSIPRRSIARERVNLKEEGEGEASFSRPTRKRGITSFLSEGVRSSAAFPSQRALAK